MRQDRYLEQYPKHLAAMRKTLRKTQADYDDVEDIVAACLDAVYRKQKYVKVTPGKLQAYLCRAVRYEYMSHARQCATRQHVVCRLPDTELAGAHCATVPAAVQEAPVIECPFCFQNNLNEYGACSMCHTIVPTFFRNRRNAIVMTKESLAVEFNFNTQIDVANAIARLSLKEQMVVKAIGLGHETLESVAALYNTYEMDIARIWIRAKQKLQVMLSEYGGQPLSKRSPNAALRAFKSLDNTTR